MRPIDDKELCHERLGDRFADALSNYDTTRRAEVLVDEFLGASLLKGAVVLDVGCGLGFFSERAQAHGAKVLATDLGPNLVERTIARVGCEGRVADALDLYTELDGQMFDVVLSSECIEHTPDPARALTEMCKVVRPGGYLSFSTPNLLWAPVVKGATLLRLRPFDGYENFSTWSGLRSTLLDAGMDIVQEKGLHLFPFQLRMHFLSRFLDENAQFLRGAMINICILARKRT